MASTPVFVPHDPAQAPTCSWRGVAVDPTRSFWPVPSLELVLSLMARYRFSVMRWRLCAGSACLLPVPGFPFDTGAGARPPSAATPAPASFGLLEAAVHHACDLFPSPVLSIVQQEGAPREETATRSRPEGKAPSRTPLDAALRTLRFHGRRAMLREEDPLTSPLLPAGGRVIHTRTIPGTDRKPGRFPTPRRILSLALTPPWDGGALRAADARGIEALLQPEWTTGPAALIRQLLPHLIVVAEAGWHGEHALPWDRLRPIIERESAHLIRALPHRSAPRA